MSPHPQESLSASEQEATLSLESMLHAKMLREKSNKGVVLRDAHPKQHGLVRAKFIVRDDIDEELKIGLFGHAEEYDTWVRFSNSLAPPKEDIKSDIRGMAIKILGVPGEKLVQGEEDCSTLDFVTVSADVFLCKDPMEFSKFIAAFIKGTTSLIPFLLTHWRTALNAYRTNKKFSNPLSIQYFSCTPYALGDKAVKYYLKPNLEDEDLPKDPDFSYLRHAMIKTLNHRDVEFDFMVQLQKNPKSMPVEDPRILWKESESPFISVAKIVIPKQKFDNSAQDEYGRRLSFNPWRTLDEHRPLGGINRARRVIYNALSDVRHSENHEPEEEPTKMLHFVQ